MADGGVAGTEAALVAAPLTPTADAVIRSGAPSTNDGSGTALGVTRASLADIKRSVVRFGQSQIAGAIPAGNVLLSARLEMKATAVSPGWKGGPVDLLRMTRSWEEGATWVCANDTVRGNTTNDCTAANGWTMRPDGPFPQPYASTVTDRVPVYSGGLTTLSFDVTSDVQAFLRGTATNFGWMLVAPANGLSGESVNFGSRENGNTGNRPKLILEYGPDQCPSDPNKGKPGVCGCNVPDVDANLDGAADCFEAAATVTGDTTVRVAQRFANDGKGTELSVTCPGLDNLERALVSMDTAAIETARDKRKLEKAYLELRVSAVHPNWAGGKLALHRMTRAWAEGTGLAGHGASWVCADDTNTTAAGNSANHCTAANTWDMLSSNPASRPFVETPTATSPVVATGVRTIRFDVTADINAFIGAPGATPAPNYGWVILGVKSDGIDGDFVRFGSRESGAPPKLLLELGPVCPNGGTTDADNDGVLDCRDECLLDPKKSEAGLCGCGKADVDTDKDKIPDCMDPCPADGDPSLGGECGCPSSKPAPAGTACHGGCESADSSGIDQCDGAGHCGAKDCKGPGGCGACTALRTTSKLYWSCACLSDAPTADAACLSRPGQALVQIESKAENDWLRTQVTGPTWIGANDVLTEGTWRWSRSTRGTKFWIGNETGKPWYGRYANWALPQPRDASSGIDCGAITPSGLWEARTCNQTLKVLCEGELSKDFPPPPPPPTPPSSDDGQCIPPNPALNIFSGPCPDGAEGDPCRAQAAKAAGELDACDACLDANKDGKCKPGASEADCAGACDKLCQGVVKAPRTGSTCPADPDSNASAVVCDLALVAGPPLFSQQVVPCTKDADCQNLLPGLRHCGRAYFCRTDNNPQNVGAPCGPDQHKTTDNDRCPADNDECVASMYCGAPVRGCLDKDPELCAEYNFCLAPENNYEPKPPANAEDLATPAELNPDEMFNKEDVPTKFATAFPEDGPCASRDNNCTPDFSTNHPWCRYNLDENLTDRSADKPTKATDKKTTAGAGSALNFTFDPHLDIGYKMGSGPLGLPLPSVSGKASLLAQANINLFGIRKPVPIIDAAVGAKAGLRANLRPADSQEFDPSKEVCGFNPEVRAKILGLDIVPANNAFNKPYPTLDAQKKCVEAVRTFTEKVDRARKAFADARELLRQRDDLIKNGLNFGDGSMPNVKSLCEQISAQVPPLNFPGVDPHYTCTNEPPERTINRFIDYYNGVTMNEMYKAAGELETQLDSWAAGTPERPGFHIDLPPYGKTEDITIFNQTFMVGPVPCNMEVTLPITYGFTGEFTADFKIGALMRKIVFPETNLDRRPEATPFVKVGVDAGPYVGAGIALFLGAGFDFGAASAKLGMEGELSLGHVEVPANAWAGITMGTEPDNRTLPPSWSGMVNTDYALVPMKKLKFGLEYGYGLNLRLDNILDGHLDAALKLKFFWFSLRYRAKLVRFKGFCQSSGERQKWCDVTLFQSKPNEHTWDWGTVLMPTPFVLLKNVPLDPPTRPVPPNSSEPPAKLPNTGSFTAERVGKIFYDSQCRQCSLAGKPCVRDADCCGTNTCQIPSGATSGTCGTPGPVVL